MRQSSLLGSRSVLEALRQGEVSFEDAAGAVRPALQLRAERFVRLWRWSGQTGVAAEDLVQEMMLALWRAVDSWDPARSDLIRYVDAQLGRACQRRLRKECGYPDPRRSVPARPIRGEAAEAVIEERATTFDPEAEIDAARRARALLRDLAGLEHHVVRLVLEGASLDAATRVIYADPAARIEYRMDSFGHARRLVGAAARKVTVEAEHASV